MSGNGFRDLVSSYPRNHRPSKTISVGGGSTISNRSQEYIAVVTLKNKTAMQSVTVNVKAGPEASAGSAFGQICVY
jgi:hypothetical protein